MNILSEVLQLSAVRVLKKTLQIWLQNTGSAMVIANLDLKSLYRDYRPGLTESVGCFMAEAIAVCLDSQNHVNKTTLSVNGAFCGDYSILLKAVSDQMKRAHNDPEVATEYGAYGISILLLDANTDLTIIERSRKGTGFDYWLGYKNVSGPYFQKKARLEVSGVRSGSESDVETRVKKKIDQTKRSDDKQIPAFVIVVEFSAPKAKVVKR